MTPLGLKPWGVSLFIKEMATIAKIVVFLAAVALVGFGSKVDLSLLVHDERPKEIVNIEVVHLTTGFLAPDLDLRRLFGDATYNPENLLLETPYVGSAGANPPPPIYPTLTQVNQELARPKHSFTPASALQLHLSPSPPCVLSRG